MAKKLTTSDYASKLSSLESNKPTEYQSKYQSTIDDLLGQITNRTFSYDFNADPLYQQYKDQYTKMGNEASMNAVANASNMTGGYANSYSATAGALANQQYMTELTNKIPELYSAALDKYNADTENLMNQYSLYADQENTAYNKYRDSVNDYNTDRDYYQTAYQNAVANDQWQQSFDYQKARDIVADEQWQKQFDENVRQFGLQYALDKAAQELSESQFAWQKETDQRDFDYQTKRDDISDSQWKQSFDYQKQRDDISDSQWKQSFDYQTKRDDISDSQWKQSFDWQKEMDNRDYNFAVSEVTNANNKSNISSFAKSITNNYTSMLSNPTQSVAAGVKYLQDTASFIYQNFGFDTVADVFSQMISDGTLSETQADDIMESLLK